MPINTDKGLNMLGLLCGRKEDVRWSGRADRDHTPVRQFAGPAAVYRKARPPRTAQRLPSPQSPDDVLEGSIP